MFKLGEGSKEDDRREKMEVMGWDVVVLYMLQVEPIKRLLVQYSNLNQIAMGGGGDGFAFALSSDLTHGTTSRSETFENEPLVSTPNDQWEQLKPFNIRNFEVWRFKEEQ